MNLIVNKVMELQEVHNTNCYGVVKGLTCTSIIKNGLTINNLESAFFGKACKVTLISALFIGNFVVEYYNIVGEGWVFL